MKQAFDAIVNVLAGGDFDNPLCDLKQAALALQQAIAEAENQDPVAVGEEWKPCVKLPVIVHVREQRKGETHVSTREGITPVKEDDLIMRGVAGEEYPIGRELFNRTYTFDTAPVHASDISQERVYETAKCGHDWGLVTDDALIEEVRRRGFTIRDAQISSKREWVGLATGEAREFYESDLSREELIHKIDEFLQEKNT